MKRYTLAEIAAANEAAGNFYFSRDTLKFFNQRKGSFKVRHVAGRIFVFAPSRWDGHLMGYSFAEFFPETGDIRKPKDHPGTFRNEYAVEDFLESLKQNQPELV
jgi:hypothetical protein